MALRFNETLISWELITEGINNMQPLKFEKINNKIYLTSCSEDWSEPRLIISYWEVKNVDPELLPDNPIIYIMGNTHIAKTGYKDIPLYIDDYPTKTEFIPIKPPKKNGYKWQYGQWVKG